MHPTPYSMPDYDSVKLTLDKAGSKLTPSQAHGIISAFICLGAEFDPDQIVQGLSSESKSAEDSYATLLASVHTETYRCLHEMSLTVELLLPQEDENLAIRAFEVMRWCSGFMDAMDAFLPDEARSEQIEEILEQIEGISKLDYAQIEISEEDEKSFSELVEFLRVAVPLLFTHLAGQFSIGQTNMTLH